ncbi:MAG: S-layer homology domain-containing protein, partial [Candidatus Gracilibacteria bacterium]
MPYKKLLFTLAVSAILICTANFADAETADTNTDADTATDTVFSDLSAGSPFFDAINYVKTEGIVSGYDDGTYKPDNQINRAEFVKIIADAVFTEDQISACTPTKTFSDVSTSDWFYPYICAASNNGVVNGYPDGSFNPGSNINFAEASKIIVSAFGYEVPSKDVWYQSSVEKLEEFKAIPGTVYSISKNISRGEMAEMVYRLKEEITDKSSMSFFSGDIETIQTTTFLKSYRVKENADSFGIVQTSDGGYAITGHTVTQTELCGYSMFWIKADSNGDKEWSKMFHNCSSDGYAITELTDGNYVIAGQVAGEFRTDEEQAELEGQGDNFIIKIDNNGNQIWSRTVSQQSIDVPANLAPTSNGGFIMSGSTGKLTGQPDVADVMHAIFLGNFSTDGETNWFKKIESDEMTTNPASVKQTSDGGYILIGSVELTEENNQDVPALVKLDENGEIEWETSLESIPLEFATVTPDGEGFIWGTAKMHLPFGNFFAAEETDNGGYIALGEFFAANFEQIDTSNLEEDFLGKSSFVGVKMNSEGELEWARTIKIKKYLEETVMKKTSDGGYIIMGNNLVGGYANKELYAQGETYNQMMEEYYEKYPIMNPETPESKAALEAISEEIESWQLGLMVRNIILVKLDKNFNYQWGKTIGGTKDLDGYDIIQTSDLGYAITGTWHTGIKYESLGATVEYTEAMILKLDVNGNLGDNNNLVADFSDTEKSDVSVYVVADELNWPELIEEYQMDNISRSIAVTNKEGVSTTASEAITYETQICSTTDTSDNFTETDIPPTTKTQGEVKYDETVEIEATSTKG